MTEGQDRDATAGEPSGHDAEEVGSVAEEAAKLFSALQDWAKESGGGHAATAAAAASTVAGGLRDVNQHLATGGEDCRYCPVCRTIEFVRNTSPEVKTNLAVAASSLLQAAAGLLATQVPDAASGRRAGDSEVQHIDLDGGADDDLDAWD